VTEGSADVDELRFGVVVLPRVGDDWRDLLLRAEDLGFDIAWAGDTLGDWLDLDAPMLDGWLTLGAMARECEDIELGMLVTNVSWRDPVQIARAAMSVDQLSNGRFTLGVGCGPVEDQVMAGARVLAMPGAERVARLDEGVDVIDRLLRGDRTAFDGAFTSYERAQMAPGCVQQPRIPLVVAGNGRKVIDVAARRADWWNTYIDTADVESFVATTRERVAWFEERVAAAGRDLDEVGRSLLVYVDVDVFSDDLLLPRIVESFTPLGFTEFVLYPPPRARLDDLIRIGVKVIPQLRG
jgi:alkanesulfonate monooxygenase SsuD/methylene tetrahydromethanopterin reductase-like flavin-dependent oxidoreductase (luciferase family)